MPFEGLRQFIGRQPVTPCFKLHLLSFLAGRDDGTSFFLGVFGCLLLGRDVAFGASIISILSKRLEGPTARIGNFLAVLVHHLTICQFKFDVVEPLDNARGGFAGGGKIGHDLVHLFDAESALGEVGPGGSDHLKRDR